MAGAHSYLVGLAALALCCGPAISQPANPDQGAAPAESNPNMGEGTGSGPAGTIGDPNGVGPGAAAPAPGPDVPPPDLTRIPAISKVDMNTLRSCQALTRQAMMTVAKCRALMKTHPELFGGPGE